MSESKQEFMYIIKPHKENFAATMTEDESRIMSIHFKYLQELLQAGRLVLAGPVITGEFGVCVFEADSEEQAREIMNNDPAVVNGIVTPMLYPYRISLLKGRD